MSITYVNHKGETVYPDQIAKKHKPGNRSRPMKGPARQTNRPFIGKVISLDASSDLKSLTIRVRGEVGRYFGENWVPA